MKTIITLITVATLLSSCKNTAEQTIKTTNNEFKVELLFTFDNVKVYRFQDGGNYKYFTNTCGTTNWSEKHGKSIVNEEIMNTVTDSIH